MNFTDTIYKTKYLRRTGVEKPYKSETCDVQLELESGRSGDEENVVSTCGQERLIDVSHNINL